MKWTEDREVQKVRKMRLANSPFMDALRFSTQQSITRVILHIISGQAVSSIMSLFWLFAWLKLVKGGF